MLVALLSAMRGGEEEYKKGEAQTKTLVYENNDGGGMGLYWMDEKANLSKATPEEIRLSEMLYPNEVIPVCKTTYYEKVESRK